jgi:hypothetical protein
MSYKDIYRVARVTILVKAYRLNPSEGWVRVFDSHPGYGCLCEISVIGGHHTQFPHFTGLTRGCQPALVAYGKGKVVPVLLLSAAP